MDAQRQETMLWQGAGRHGFVEACANQAYVLILSDRNYRHARDRISPQSKRRLERAAAYVDKTLTECVVDVALQKADSVKKVKIAAETIAMAVMVVDPIDLGAQTFHASFGFQSLRGPQRRMFLAIRGGAPKQP